MRPPSRITQGKGGPQGDQADQNKYAQNNPIEVFKLSLGVGSFSMGFTL